MNPINGEDFTVLASHVNTECMNIFLDMMAQHLGSRKASLVMDCAGWHKSKGLVVPPNIKIVYLPPYSPELNPVERLWRYIKHHTIRNRVYDTLSTLETVVSDFLITLETDTLQSLCSIDYL